MTVEQESGDQSSTIEYALDGSETTVELGNGTLTVTATWDGAALVTDGTQSIETGRRQLLARHHRAADAQLRTARPSRLETTRGTPRGDQTFTLVYQKEM